MLTRRELLQLAAATAAIAGAGGGWTRAFAQQRLTQAELLAFQPLGNVTLVHVTDIHAQLEPIHFREPTVNIGVGEAKGLPPHLTGRALAPGDPDTQVELGLAYAAVITWIWW